MGFSVKQRRALNSELKPAAIRTRQRQGRELNYIEGWHAIAEANRIFGPDGWNRETVETKCLLGRERQGQYEAVYVARVRITVRAADETVTRDGIGSGEAQGDSLGEAHDKAIKTAETDATKRALATFGKPFGLSLYLGKHQAIPQVKSADLPSTVGRRRTLQRLGPNGRFYVERKPAPVLDPDLNRVARAPRSDDAQVNGLSKAGGPSGVTSGSMANVSAYPGESEKPTKSSLDIEPGNLAPTGAPTTVPSHDPDRDKAVMNAADAPSPMLLPRPARRREPGHLRYVATQPCLLCGRTPSDAHHLKFAQPRAMSRKVSDEFTVPLCRTHHRQLHDSGNEIAWWIDMDIDPLPIAHDLWAESTGAQRRQKAETTSEKN